MRRSLKRKRRRRRGRLGLWLALAAIPVAGLTAVIAVLAFATFLGGSAALAATSILFDDLPDVRAVATFEESLFENSSVYSADGTRLGEIASEGRRTLVAAEDIPQLVKDAVIASEDSSFYENPGVDFWAIVRAVWLNLQGQAIVSGFSTLTQQVVKNTLAKRAVEGTDKEPLAVMFSGMTGVVISGDDPVAAARAVKDAMGKESKIVVKGAILEGSVLEAAAALGVADMASKEEMLATLLRTMQEAPRQVLGVLSGPGRDLVYLLKNFETKLAETQGNE